MITPVLDFLLESKGKLEASKRAFDSMLMETMELLFSIAEKECPKAERAWQSVKENGNATISDLRKRRWGTIGYNGIFYLLRGQKVTILGTPYISFCEYGIEAFYFDDDGSNGCGWYLFSDDKQVTKEEEEEYGTKEANGNLH